MENGGMSQGTGGKGMEDETIWHFGRLFGSYDESKTLRMACIPVIIRLELE
jgi:hypothetical protein